MGRIVDLADSTWSLSCNDCWAADRDDDLSDGGNNITRATLRRRMHAHRKATGHRHYTWSAMGSTTLPPEDA